MLRAPAINMEGLLRRAHWATFKTQPILVKQATRQEGCRTYDKATLVNCAIATMQPSGAFFLSALLFLALVAVNQNIWLWQDDCSATEEEPLQFLQTCQSAMPVASYNMTWNRQLYAIDPLVRAIDVER